MASRQRFARPRLSMTHFRVCISFIWRLAIHERNLPMESISTLFGDYIERSLLAALVPLIFGVVVITPLAFASVMASSLFEAVSHRAAWRWLSIPSFVVSSVFGLTLTATAVHSAGCCGAIGRIIAGDAYIAVHQSHSTYLPWLIQNPGAWVTFSLVRHVFPVYPGTTIIAT